MLKFQKYLFITLFKYIISFLNDECLLILLSKVRFYEESFNKKILKNFCIKNKNANFDKNLIYI